MQNPADTHINACAVLSQLGRHQTALEHAQQALILLQEELLSPPGSSEAAAPPQVESDLSLFFRREILLPIYPLDCL